MQNVQINEDSWDDEEFQFYQSSELSFWDEVDAMAQGFYISDKNYDNQR
jgi:hypothetical protein